jgi:spoIIIJ-associated protein
VCITQASPVYFSVHQKSMSQINDPGSTAKKIADFLQTLVKGGLELKSEIIACNGQVQPNSSDSAGASPLASIPTVSVEDTSSFPPIKVELSGPDTPLLLARNGELLHAIEHIAAKILRLEPEDHDRISFDAEDFKATRDRNLQLSAEAAIQKVRATGQPYAFPPMTSRERRMLHLVLAQSGLPTASSGEVPRRFVVLYPEGHQPATATPQGKLPDELPGESRAKFHKESHDRTRAIRSSFRPR